MPTLAPKNEDVDFCQFLKQTSCICYQINHQTNTCLPLFGSTEDRPSGNDDVNKDNANNITSIPAQGSRCHALLEISQVVSLFLSQKYSLDPFYFIFDEDKSRYRSRFMSKKKENSCDGSDFNENNNVDLSSSTITDMTMTREIVNSDSHSSNDGQSVFGSPLALQAIADLSAVNGYLTSTPSVRKLEYNTLKLQGLSIQHARDILRRFCQSDSESDKESLLKTIVILCDGCDVRRTILLGAHKEESGGKKILRTFCETLKNSQRMKLSSLQPFNVNKEIEYRMSGDYELLDKRDSMGSMVLQAQWVDQHGFPRISNLPSAKFSLTLSALSGCPDSPMYQYHKQLEDVRYLFKTLRDLSNGDISCFWRKQDFDAIQNLQELFTRIKKGEESSLMFMTCDPGKRISFAPQRDADFTDKLWIIFQQCACYEDMLECLKFVLKTLQKREMSVYVHKDNQTILAQLVRQSSLGFASFPPLVGGLPLKMIVEIGIEKIKRDYCAILTEGGLCTSQNLDIFLKACQRDDDSESFSYDVENVKYSQMDTITKLHHCLELVSIVDSYSEHLDMHTVVNEVLGQYKTEKLDENQAFTVPVMAKQAILQIKNVSASMIRREFEVSGDCYVDCYLSEIPDGLAVPVTDSSDSCDVSSSVLGESKEFYTFHMQEKLKILG